MTSDQLPNQLKEAIRNLRRRTPSGVDLSPRSPFDALLEERLKALERQVEEVKSRVHGLIFLIAGAVMVQVVVSFFR